MAGGPGPELAVSHGLEYRLLFCVFAVQNDNRFVLRISMRDIDIFSTDVVDGFYLPYLPPLHLHRFFILFSFTFDLVFAPNLSVKIALMLRCC